MKNFRAYFMENIRWLAVIGFIALVTAVTMLLNGIPANEIGYGMLLCGFVMVVALLIGYGRHRESFRQLSQMQETIVAAPEDMKTPEYMYEKQYQACIRAIAQEKDRLQKEMNHRQRDLSEYYSMWVHQVKTPIASMRLQLDAEDSALSRCLRSELLRIEQYVEMVLTYFKLGPDSSDYVFRTVCLDKVLRDSIRKFRGDFIMKKLGLVYVPSDVTIVSDEKWLSFVVEQLLSNALKYTNEGSVTIALEAPKTLCISDTGIGIAPEDLPRIFEKGYTGGNGRENKRASGLGLYLCRQVCDRLGIAISIASEVEKGTTVRLDLNQRQMILK